MHTFRWDYSKEGGLKKTITYKIFIITLVAIVFALGFIFLPKFIDISEIRGFLIEKKFSSYSIFTIFQIFQSLSIIIPLTPLTLAGGAVFGSYTGFLLSWLGVICGQIIAFSASRFLGKNFIESKVLATKIQEDRYDQIEVFVNSWALIPILLMYCSGVFSFDLLSYILGLTTIRFYKWFIMVAIGIAPKLFLLSFFADRYASDEQVNSFLWLIALILIVIWISSYLIYKKFFSAKSL